MTTKVTVDAHAGWDVEVSSIDKDSNHQYKNTVKAFTVQDFYVHESNTIVIKELPREG